MLKGNGNFLERLLGDLVLGGDRALLDQARAVVRPLLSRRVARHYGGFATSQLRAFDEKPSAKRALYVLRTAATGRHLLARGELVTDVARLGPFLPAGTDELLEMKRRGERQGSPPSRPPPGASGSPPRSPPSTPVVRLGAAPGSAGARRGRPRGLAPRRPLPLLVAPARAPAAAARHAARCARKRPALLDVSRSGHPCGRLHAPHVARADPGPSTRPEGCILCEPAGPGLARHAGAALLEATATQLLQSQEVTWD